MYKKYFLRNTKKKKPKNRPLVELLNIKSSFFRGSFFVCWFRYFHLFIAFADVVRSSLHYNFKSDVDSSKDAVKSSNFPLPSSLLNPLNQTQNQFFLSARNGDACTIAKLQIAPIRFHIFFYIFHIHKMRFM